VADFNGRVSGADEIPLNFSQRTTIVTVLVKPGQSVAADTVLAAADTKTINDALSTAQDQVQTLQITLDSQR
jgi:multidrug efflux pump subunit AcrA (membrane-fusion protein)